ncbi:hypothetical protein EJ06DRAFT_558116 [Trichodelitschia bisporula]|uniref:Attractin/MKLN-like beta-propeller domain-containing protein n=1 Tax=Trichodelitschia bisporula TaxID=703511 RepID=A0A6G1HQG8_9PEZI|nr:hypothetical protein EJ06DRAFT_558116 [Trichodelitschia bisporula]
MVTAVLLRLSVVAALVGLSVQQKDPLKDFCRRFGHQTALVDHKLYIDGGLINYNPIPQNPLNYTNTNLLYADLNVDNQGMPNEYNNLTKPASVPSVAGGILWPDTVNKYFYLYGGEFQGSPEGFTMWQYDAIYDKWASLPPDVTQSGIQRASFGAGAVQQQTGMAFWYGGWLNNATVPSFGPPQVALSNLLTYNMLKNTWTNTTGPDSIGRAEGVMVYIPASDGGMLVYFGGVQQAYNNGTWTGVPMSQIFLYDIANAKWYTQTATGNVPDMRRRFCAGATWAQDQSSYNIYLYGGASMPPNTVGFDDIYILSLPSFTWIKWYPTEPGQGYPHHSLSCTVVDGAQMLVMGGTFPNSTDCDVPGVFAFHNMDLGKQNSDNAKWALFSPNKTGYKVPGEITAEIGGTALGGATLRAPKAGYDYRDLGTYFQRTYQPASARTPTRAIPTSTGPATHSPSTKPKHIGAIAGGAAAGGILLLALLALLLVCLKKRRARRAAAATPPPPHAEMYHGPQSPHAPQYYPPPQAPVQLPDSYPPSELPAAAGYGYASPPPGAVHKASPSLDKPPYTGSPSPHGASPPPQHMQAGPSPPTWGYGQSPPGPSPPGVSPGYGGQGGGAPGVSPGYGGQGGAPPYDYGRQGQYAQPQPGYFPVPQGSPTGPGYLPGR